ncbi:MAG: ATP-binding protein [Kangiellaceae bacterium]|nr:ATP-binding protein [Kangiellaceae bacterium]MCW8997522.1 ATP-binding protein [Kangiellaceae bacterium]
MSNDAYKIAYERERKARLAAEKMLDEKTREVTNSMSLVKAQFEELMARNKELDLLVTVANFTQKQMSLTEALKQFIEILGEATNSPYIVVYLLKQPSHCLKLIEIKWPTDNFPGELHNLLSSADNLEGASLAARVLKNKKTVCWSASDKNFPNRSQLFNGALIDGAYAFPIMRFGEVVAIIEVGVKDWLTFQASWVNQVESVAIQLGVALERRKAQKNTEVKVKELESALETLQAAQTQLIQSEKLASLGELAAGVAHEINNPISFVLSNMETLEEYTVVFQQLIKHYQKLASDPVDSDEISRTIQELEREEDINFILTDIEPMLSDAVAGLKRVKGIVNSLKRFARQEESESQPADINQCVENALKLTNNEIKYKANVVKELAPVPIIDCRPNQLEQVFVNIIINACQAIDDKGTIQITSKFENDNIKVEIVDNGKGIDKDKLNSIFDPFYTTKPVGVGTGLGLSISYGIIEKHKGRIEVESSPGKGTKFITYLPVE